MRRLTLVSLVAVFLAAVLFATDGPLTPIAQLRGRTDGNGYLLVSGGTYGGVDGPLTPIGNLRGRTDQNGYLRVALAGGSISSPLLAADGLVSAPSYSYASDPTTGFYRSSAGVVRYSSANNDRFAFATNLNLREDATLQWVTSNTFGTVATTLIQDGANLLAQKNGTAAQAFRVYGTTTGPKYLSLSHDGTNGVIDVAASSGTLSLAPTNATQITMGKPMSLSSAAVSVANVGANSCGTSAATIAGSNNAFVITVGATSGTQCRVAFTVAAATEWNCTSTDSTTTIATRTTPVDTTHTDFLGAFTAGDKVTGICFAR